MCSRDSRLVGLPLMLMLRAVLLPPMEDMEEEMEERSRPELMQLREPRLGQVSAGRVPYT
jgi:hypothetical protein